jgi:hypothetical protein
MENDQLAQSEADAGRVTKAQVLQFLELQFSLADTDKDGALDIHELRTLVNALGPSRHRREADFSDARHLGGFTEERPGAFRTQVSAAAAGLHHSN